MDSVYNNTSIPLNAGDIWEGKSESVSKFSVAMVSCISDTSGSLQLYFSQNNVDFDFVKQYEPKPGQPFVINQKVEAKWFKAKFINISTVNQTYLRLTTIYKDDIRSDLDIRPLNSEKDTIGIPSLEECITDGKLNVNVEGITVSDISVDINGQTVDIEGQTVKSQIYDYNNYAITSQVVGSKRGLDVNNIGTTKAFEGTLVKEVGAYTDIHNNVNLLVYDDALNDKVNNVDTVGEDTGAIKVYVSNSMNNKVKCDISGQRVDISGMMVDISGQTLNVNTISGFALETGGNLEDIKTNSDKFTFDGDNLLATISNTSFQVSNFPLVQDVKVVDKIDISGVGVNGDKLKVDISGQRVDISGMRIDISGQRVLVDISGQRVVCDISGQRVDISGSRIDISGARVDISGARVDISGQRVVCDISGQRVDISGMTVDISGQRIDISGMRVDISGQRVDITGQTLNVNTISGFATSVLQTAGNTSLSDIKTNTDKNKYVGDDLKTVISNTGFDAKIRDKDNNAISSTAVGIDGVRGLDVVLKNGTPAEPISILIDPTNIVNVSVGNFPAEYSISAGGALSSATGALNVNLRNTAGDAVGISGAPLVVESNLITGFALESGGNLAGVKTNTDKFKFTGDDLKTTITNASLIVETGTNALDVNITGGTLTGANGKAYLYSGDEATSITATTVGGKNGIDSNIINSSIDTHCYGSSNGTNWHHLSTDSNGQLNVHSKLQDGAGTDLTSTLNGAKQSLDVNVANNGSIIIDISGATTNINRLNVFDASANSLLSTINVGVGDFTNIFAFGNFISNASIGSSANSTTLTFTRGDYKRNTMLIYRDNSTGNTDSISFYSNSTIGTATPCLLATVYPITVGGYRWVNVNVNLLPFQDLFIRNDSTSGITGVYLSVING